MPDTGTPADGPAPSAAAGPAHGFTLRLLPSGLALPVAPGQTLLQAVQAHGLALPSACRQGECRRCLAHRVEGEVEWTVPWPGVSAEEQAQGWTLPCVVRPRSATVALQIHWRPPPLQVRRATQHDDQACAQALAEWGLPPQPDPRWVALSDLGVVWGLCGAGPTADGGSQIGTLRVRAGAEGHGIGTRLLRAALASLPRPVVWPLAPADTLRQRMAQRQGFVQQRPGAVTGAARQDQPPATWVLRL